MRAGKISFSGGLVSMLLKAGSHRSSRAQVFFKIGVLKNFAIFIGKHLCWSFFLDSNTGVFL